MLLYEEQDLKQKTVPGTSQNGVTEHMNRTILERARCMRLQSKLSKKFLAEAVDIDAYLINRGPSTILDLSLSEEAYTNKEISLAHLQVFGCTACVGESERGRS